MLAVNDEVLYSDVITELQTFWHCKKTLVDTIAYVVQFVVMCSNCGTSIHL